MFLIISHLKTETIAKKIYFPHEQAISLTKREKYIFAVRYKIKTGKFN